MGITFQNVQANTAQLIYTPNIVSPWTHEPLAATHRYLGDKSWLEIEPLVGSSDTLQVGIARA
jgi:hypothetical protein